MRKTLNHVRHHFVSTLFVTACVTILHFSTSWLDALDGYSYLWVGNLASTSGQAVKESDRVAVVEIDDAHYENAFGRRSPLKRDQLLVLLDKIYAANPRLLVVDLDLAPAADDLLQVEEKCKEEEIKALIIKKSSDTATVLLDPFPVQFDRDKRSRETWRDDLRANEHVLFGHGGIPERFGMSNWFFRDQNSLFAAARRAIKPMDPLAGSKPASTVFTREKQMIDIRTYLNSLTIVSTTPPNQGTKDLTCRIREAFGKASCLPAAEEAPQGVVYFGAAFGGDDLFTTPLGRLYGVEVHAAAFATCLPEDACSTLHAIAHHSWAMLLDLVAAFVVGFFIARLWKKYVNWRTDPDPEISAVAGVAALKLIWVLAIALLALTVVAGICLAWFGIWISPIPISVGMFIDAWVIGPIAKPDAIAPRESAGDDAPIPEIIETRMHVETPELIADYASIATLPAARRATVGAPTLLFIPVSLNALKLFKRLIVWPVIAVALVLVFTQN